MKVFFAGGGTAGHVNPALAIASYLKTNEPGCELAFSGGAGGIEETLVGRAGYPIYTFPLSGLSRSMSLGGVHKNFRAVRNTVSALSAAKKIIRREKPDLVIGTGGYACFPMVRAAQAVGVKTMLVEVNATPGVALKRLARKADTILVSFEETKKHFPQSKRVICTGSPVRPEMFEGRRTSQEPLFDNGKPTVLCFWGSVGAMYMNKKMEEFIELLDLDGSFNLMQAAGKTNYAWMPDEIRAHGVDLDHSANVRLTEYIYDMGHVMNACDLVICRAGASTLAEVCACGKPSLIVPSPYVADNHQEKNARALERAGAARVALEKEVDGKALFELTKAMLADRVSLAVMGAKAASLARPDALERIHAAIRETLAR